MVLPTGPAFPNEARRKKIATTKNMIEKTTYLVSSLSPENPVFMEIFFALLFFKKPESFFFFFDMEI
jgi:hypothetical protein